MIQDVRRTLRSLARSPLFFVASVGSLTLGVGACASVFAVLNALLLQPLPYAAPEALVELYATGSLESTQPGDYFATERARRWPDLDFRGLQGVAREQGMAFSFSVERAAPTSGRPVGGAAVTARWFDVLGVDAGVGRALTEADALPGALPAAVISRALWNEAFAEDRSALGRTIWISDRPYTLVGVMPASFEADPAVWVPYSTVEDQAPASGRMIGRLADGTSVDQARLEVARVAALEVEADSAAFGGRGATLMPMGQLARENGASALWLTLGVVGAVFLLSLTNLTTLFLVRAADRSKDVAVRASLGASSWQVGRHLLGEALIVGGLGAVGSLIVARWGREIVLRAMGGSMFLHTPPSIDLWVAVFAVLIAAGTALLVGLEPIRHIRRLDLLSALHKRSSAITLTPAERRTRGALLTTQVALAVLLLSASISTAAAYRAYGLIDVGYDARQMVEAELDYLAAGLTREEIEARTDAFTSAVAEHPGIIAATRWQTYTLSFPPPPEGHLVLDHDTEFVNPAEREGRIFRYYGVDHDFLATARLDLLRGRALGPSDRAETELVAMISEDAALLWWPDDDALGRRFRLGADAPWITVVGIVENASELRSIARLWTLIPRRRNQQFYVPFDQASGLGPHWGIPGGAFRQNPSIAVRSTQGPEVAESALRSAIGLHFPAVRPLYVGSMWDRQMGEFGGQNLALSRTLVGAAASAGLLIALLGVLGVVGESLARRRREIGIRMALGARARHVIATVTTESLALTGGGVAIGVGGAWLVRGLLDRSVFPGSLTSLGVDTGDARIIAGAALLLMTVSGATSMLAARRATRIDAADAIRAE